MTGPAVAEAVVEALRFQRGAFEVASLASPLYAALTEATLRDVAAGGPCAAVLAEVPAGLEPVADAVSLRWLGAVHRLVLSGRAPGLAAYFETAGGRFDPAADDPGPALVAAAAEHRDELVAGLALGVQTNEVGRCAALAVGFTELLRRYQRPLRLLEVGASAGLNLRWDRWRYESGPAAWGDEDAALTFAAPYREPFPDIAAPLGPADAVAERAGCDRSPIDPTTDEGALALTAFVWPDQAPRHERLAAALDAARRVPAAVEAADAGDWCERRLAEPAPGVATVVFHSVVWQYLSVESRRRMAAALGSAGRRATPDAPFAWLRMEPGAHLSDAAELRLRTWPGPAHDELLACTGFHGHPVWRA